VSRIVADQLGAGGPQRLRGRVRQVVRISLPWRSYLRYGVASGLLQQVLFMAGSGFAAYAAGRAALGAGYGSVVFYLLGIMVIVLLQVRPPWLESISFQFIANRVQVELRAQVYQALERLTPAGLEGRRSGDLGSAALADVTLIQRFFAETLSTLIVASVVPLLALVAVAVMSWPLAVLALAFVALAAAVPLGLHRGMAARGLTRRQDQAIRSAEVVDQVQGLREILTFNAGAARLGPVAGEERHHGVDRSAGSGEASAERVATDLIATAGTIAVVVLGAILSGHHDVSPTLVVPATVLVALSFGPVARLVNSLQGLGDVSAAGERIFSLVERPVPAGSGGALPGDATAARDTMWNRATGGTGSTGALPPAVAFHQVTFRYGAGLPPALSEVSFAVAPGETVALVGHSGAGKSTCVNLLLRFWDVDAGRVTVGGVDVRTLSQSQLHHRVGWVPQDVYLFHTTIRENLRLGRPEATDHQLEVAARAAQAWEFIQALPDGLDTHTGERGVQLSGGQRQRLAIARALLADPPVLALDEPVSNLDSENEAALTLAMTELRKGRATLIIAHRLSTIQGADRLVVLDHGRVAEVGTHEELLRGGNAYATLMASQLSGSAASSSIRPEPGG
jgi:ABC-type multidrug transport system fused ATPase/permease subunit